MNIHQFDPKIVSITQLRRDIDVLNKVLEKEQEAVVVKNQKILFIAVAPERYQQFKSKKNDYQETAIQAMKTIQSRHRSNKELASNYVIRMRNERTAKWKK